MEWMMVLFSVPKVLHNAMFDFVLCLWVMGVFSLPLTLYSMLYCSQICFWLWASLASGWCHVSQIKANREVTGLFVLPSSTCFQVWTKLFPCAWSGFHSTFNFFRTRIEIVISVNMTLCPNLMFLNGVCGKWVKQQHFLYKAIPSLLHSWSWHYKRLTCNASFLQPSVTQLESQGGVGVLMLSC